MAALSSFSVGIEDSTIQLYRAECEWAEDMLVAAFLARMPVSHVGYYSHPRGQTMMIVLEGGYIWASREYPYAQIPK